MEIYIAIFLIYFVSFFIKGVAGFGDPLVSSAAMTVFYPNSVISPVNLFLCTPINGYISWRNRRAFSIKEILPILICILLGIIPGALLLKYASSWILKAGLGLLLVILGIEMITRDRSKPLGGNTFAMIVSSFFSGLTSGLYGINMFFVAYLERTTKGRSAFRGNVCFIFFIENVYRIIVYAVGGIITSEIFKLSMIAFPAVILGFVSGNLVDKRLSDKFVRYFAIIVFMLSGASILVKAVLQELLIVF